MTSETLEITDFLGRWSEGDRDALERLVPLVIGDLRRLAGWHFKQEPGEHTLQPTALVSEVFLRILGRRKVQWHNRKQFFHAATELMRCILIDYARRRRAVKRGRDVVKVPLDAQPIPLNLPDHIDILALHDAVAKLDARRRFITERRMYFGMTHREIGQELGLAEDTVKEQWGMIRARLYRDLSMVRTDAPPIL